MLSCEFEGRQIMIKDLGCPAFRIVATGTVCPKVGRVGIVWLMTPSTIGRGFIETRKISHPSVAIDAFDISMLAKQRKY